MPAAPGESRVAAGPTAGPSWETVLLLVLTCPHPGMVHLVPLPVQSPPAPPAPPGPLPGLLLLLTAAFSLGLAVRGALPGPAVDLAVGSSGPVPVLVPAPARLTAWARSPPLPPCPRLAPGHPVTFQSLLLQATRNRHKTRNQQAQSFFSQSKVIKAVKNQQVASWSIPATSRPFLGGDIGGNTMGGAGGSDWVPALLV